MDVKVLFQDNENFYVSRYLMASLGPTSTLVLGAAIEYYEKLKLSGRAPEDGFFRFSHQEMSEIISIRAGEMKDDIKKLKRLGLIETRLVGSPAEKYIKINEDKTALLKLYKKGEKKYNKSLGLGDDNGR